MDQPTAFDNRPKLLDHLRSCLHDYDDAHLLISSHDDDNTIYAHLTDGRQLILVIVLLNPSSPAK